ncbi:hypothetical protein LNN31_13730 [Acetobacterium wieringae]|uniref:DUF1540 domain-containing protein n=1 Tax=Acetobacterium wieringae TaxID=52694 RepID=A0ABY6HBE5_9FIRM|nr:hypothetical protein [Acetobacterium wieringae]UYO61835.1 hypothetical protein LNN31_13730 [Acetobacterium wieringae]
MSEKILMINCHNCENHTENGGMCYGVSINAEVIMCADFYLKEDLRDEHHHCRTGHAAVQ